MTRLALILALALSLCAHAVSAQDTVRVVPPDSAGYVSRTQTEQFLRTLLTAAPAAGVVAPWEPFSGSGRTANVVAQFDSVTARQATEQNIAAMREHVMRRLGVRAFGADSTLDTRHGLFGLSPNTADITFDGLLQFQIGTTRQVNLACTPAQVQDPSSGCGGGFKPPSIDNTVQLSSHGIFAQRFHLNIDFDSKRDYGANNIVSAWYQGLEDEKLRSVNIGTVQFVPPPSRFFTASIPTNNFGISAVAEFGPVRMQAIFATQKGSVVTGKTYTIGSSVVAPQDNTTRDLDYESDRFFWVVDPRTLPGYPTLDILNSSAISVTPAVQPANVRIYRYVSANQSAGANSNYDGITALAANGSERTGALRWRMLKPNVDYWIDPSGLWFVLTAKINPSDYLAVSYSTIAGTAETRVGSLPSTDNPDAKDSLRLIYTPNRGPASPLFPYEMRQVYRVAGSSLVRSSLKAQILVAGSERPDSAPGTFLSLLGLATPSDQATFDVDNRLFPRVRDAGAAQVIKDALIVFPSVTPFGHAGLTAAEQNDSLYVTPEYLLFTQGPPSKFLLHLQFDAQSGADRSSITLEALQITDGSEHIALNGQPLAKGKDYTIDYTTGRVTFLDPNTLFGNGVATITASFEQRGLFAVAPTTIAGLTATWSLGLNKTLSFSGLYQAEATGYTRPQIGYEPQASTLLGMTGDLLWNTPGITRWLNRLVTKKSTAPSTFRLTGEVAMSRPDPNRSGDAYLEEFEDDHSINISAGETAWVPGSMPKSSAGLTGVLSPQGFDSAGAVRMIWQNLVPNGRDSITQLSPSDIDPTVALTQSTTPTIAPVLWMALHADTAGGVFSDSSNRAHWTQVGNRHQARWASMTTALSPTGTDLTRNDYFEFAMYQTADTTVQHTKTRIVLDLGQVSEDALAIAPANFIVLQQADLAQYPQFRVGDTVYTGRQYVGVGALNTEKSQFGTWSATTDDNGILADRPDSLIGRGGVILRQPALCTDVLGARTLLYPWGDLGARCSNRNGVPDTEDLDGDNVLDAQGSADNVFRYVIDLADSSKKYFVRSHTVFAGAGRTAADSAHSATWTIYHVPLRLADDTIGAPDMHLIKQMRLSVVAPPDPTGPGQVVFFALALMKFTGAAWVARAAEPIISISGPLATFHGSVVVGTVSTQDGDSLGHGYQSPPGIVNATTTVAVASSQFSQQINERSLSIQVTDLHPGERAEAYSRLVAGTQNLLNYRQLRVWTRGGNRLTGKSPGWDNGQLVAYVKLGSDAYNFYMYRAPASTTTWDPEMVIDLQTWKDLRQQVETERLNQMPPSASDWRRCGADSTAYVACSLDLAYVVQVHDPLVNPPNLAAVQELAAGIYYPVSTFTSPITTELWVDDIRVGLPVANTGVVGAISARMVLSDVATIDLSGAYQNGNFHLMGQSPTYQNTATFGASSTMHVEKFLPLRLGLLVPVSVTTNYGWIDPQLLSGTDVEAAGLAGLRRPRNDATAWTFSILHPARPTSDHLTRLVLNPFSFSASGSNSSTTTSLSDVSTANWATTLNYFLNSQRHAYAMHLKRLVSGLPRWLRESEGGRGVANASFAPWPTLVQFSSSLSHTMGDLQAYQVPIMVLADTILKPVTSEQFLWRNSASLTWIPFSMLTASSNWSSTRDLRQYPDSTSIGRVANAEHSSLLGTDVGVESNRVLSSTIQFGPHLASWLAPSVSVSSNFVLSRDLTSRNPVRIDGDTAGAYILPQTLNDSRVTTWLVSIDPRKLVQRLFGDSSGISRALTNVRPIQFSQSRTLESTFDLARFNPSLGYQLALGGFSSFLARDGQEAIGAANATNTALTASIDLRAGFSAQLNYSSTTSDRYEHTQGPTGFLETTGSTESWPSGRFNWARTFRKGPIVSVSASTQVQQDRATSSSPFDDGTASIASSETQRVTPDVLLIFRNAMTLRVSGEVDHSNSAFGGNNTQTASSNLSGNFSWQVRMPKFLSATRRNITTNLTVTENNSSSCIQGTTDSTCVPYYDLRRLEVNTSFRALLEHGITGGLQFGYVHNDVRSLGQLTSTITINATITVPLSSLGM